MGPAQILVLAGTNGAGKSSVAGAALERQGGHFYDPDRATLAYLDRGLPRPEANSRAWRRGRQQLERAIREGRDYAFETTLGGRTISRLLRQAADHGHALRIWYVGLENPELHVERVRRRVARGGHHIPEERIRDRFDASRRNLIRLLPHITELAVFDNSRDADPSQGRSPRPFKLLHVRKGGMDFMAASDRVPDWAKPILAAALNCFPSIRFGGGSR